jgi:hypothetical protein
MVAVFGQVNPGPLVVQQLTPYEWRAYDARGSGAGYSVCTSECFYVPRGEGMGVWVYITLPETNVVQTIEGPQ